MKQFLILPLCVAVASFLTACGSKPHIASPIHQTAVFMDGIDNFDFRAACATLNLKPYNQLVMHRCEAYYSEVAAINGPAEYRVVPNSTVYKSPTEATVKAKGYGFDYGITILVHLQLIKGHWIIMSLGPT